MTSLKICRVCLVDSQNLYLAVNSQLVDVYEILTQVKLKNGQPATLCHVCLTQLRKCQRFMETAQESNRILEQWQTDQTEFKPRPLFTYTTTPPEVVDFDDLQEIAEQKIKMEKGEEDECNVTPNLENIQKDPLKTEQEAILDESNTQNNKISDTLTFEMSDTGTISSEMSDTEQTDVNKTLFNSAETGNAQGNCSAQTGNAQENISALDSQQSKMCTKKKTVLYMGFPEKDDDYVPKDSSEDEFCNQNPGKRKLKQRFVKTQAELSRTMKEAKKREKKQAKRKQQIEKLMAKKRKIETIKMPTFRLRTDNMPASCRTRFELPRTENPSRNENMPTRFQPRFELPRTENPSRNENMPTRFQPRFELPRTENPSRNEKMPTRFQPRFKLPRTENTSQIENTPSAIFQPQNGNMPSPTNILPLTEDIPRIENMPRIECVFTMNVNIPQTKKTRIDSIPRTENMPQTENKSHGDNMPRDHENIFGIMPRAGSLENTPQSDKMPQSGSMPQSDNMPQSGSMPRADSIPRDLEIPQSNSMAQSSSMPQADSMPRADSIPRADSMPQTDIMPQTKNTAKTFKCQKCTFKCKTETELAKHNKSRKHIYKEKHFCSICDVKCSTIDTLRKHIAKKHC